MRTIVSACVPLVFSTLCLGDSWQGDNTSLQNPADASVKLHTQAENAPESAIQVIPSGKYILRKASAFKSNEVKLKRLELTLKIEPMKEAKNPIREYIRDSHGTFIVLKQSGKWKKSGAIHKTSTLTQFAANFTAPVGDLHLTHTVSMSEQPRQVVFPNEILIFIRKINPSLVTSEGTNRLSQCIESTYTYNSKAQVLTLKIVLANAPDKPLYFDFYKDDAGMKVKLQRLRWRMSAEFKGRSN